MFIFGAKVWVSVIVEFLGSVPGVWRIACGEQKEKSDDAKRGCGRECDLVKSF